MTWQDYVLCCATAVFVMFMLGLVVALVEDLERDAKRNRRVKR